jgi:hypothetical protein
LFVNEKLQEHLETSSVVKIDSVVVAEWNMNIAENILKAGNERYRPSGTVLPTPPPATTDDEEPVFSIFPTPSEYGLLTQTFDEDDEVNRFYTGATDADVVVDGGLDFGGEPIAFVSKKEKERLLYSLEDCFGRFRPRSGINKLRYFEGKYTHFSNMNMALRPRYYISDKDDKFKYWTSYRTENGIEQGVANINLNGQNFINDAVPFVVYKDPVPANRIVVKMQTNVGGIDLGAFLGADSFFEDPFFGDNNRTVPTRWKIQYLDEDNSWIDALSFDENSVRGDGSQVIKEDGYVEIQYGLLVPEIYQSGFEILKSYPSESMLPDPTEMPSGSAYLVRDNEQDPGTVFVVLNNRLLNSGFYESFPASYGWFLGEEGVSNTTSFARDLTDPPRFVNPATGSVQFKDFLFVKGIRVVVETMNVPDSTFDLIELSPRLVSDLSDKVFEFSLSKTASDLGATGLPVGQLLASIGNLQIFDYDQAFFSQNFNSIVSKYVFQHIQFKFFEVIREVDGESYYIPIKTMYSDGFPKQSNTDREISVELRDLFFYFESMTAPELFLTDASVSSAVSTILDAIGFSNYVFLRNPGESEEVIPYFYVEPEKTIALVLQDIAVSTQSAMFFDEFNNFVVASKNYILPKPDERETDITLSGSVDFEKNNQIKNEITNEKLANIADISFQNNDVFNSGIINYTTKSIQRSYGSIRQALLQDVEKTWIYKPALLWEVAPNEATKPINDEIQDQSAYALAAIPLNSDLSDQAPSVANHQIINNTMDLGDGVYWTARYNGYFFANGEIVKYDAIQFSITGLSDEDSEADEAEGDNVWISSVQEYRKYFSKITFNGKLYPTGLVRIYSEPNLEIIDGQTRLKNGPVAKHGRSQFGTGIKKSDGSFSPVYHNAGLSDHWTNINNRRGCEMDFKYIFSDEIRKGRYQDVKVISNEEVAVLLIEDNVGVSLGNLAARVLPTNEEPPETNIIPETARVLAVEHVFSAFDETPETLITLNQTVENFDDEELFEILIIEKIPETEEGPAGIDKEVFKNSSVGSLIKNVFRSQQLEETSQRFVYPATVQSSALIFKGNVVESAERPTEFVSYIYKPLDDRFKHFGTRMRIVGKVENNEVRGQFAEGASTYFTSQDLLPGQSASIAGGSGGLAVMINPETNNGYYFEIAALSEEDLNSYSDDPEGLGSTINNIFFYKVSKDTNFQSPSAKAVPQKLFGGIGAINVDDGIFTGQARVATERFPTVYDLAVEYEDVEGVRVFYLYINNVLVGTAQDNDPLPVVNNMAVFVRGNSKCMFENVYALDSNYSQNTSFSLDAPVHSAFGQIELNADNSFRKYAISGLLQSTYLSGIGSLEPPKYNVYFEEFGTIMREAAYFNVKYDKAYPALIAQISPTISRLKGFTISGFIAGAYGAEFLVFNNTDTVLNLDSTSGNYLRIQGVALTGMSENQLTVDEFFEKKSDFSSFAFSGSDLVQSPIDAKKDFIDIKLSRLTQGIKEFNITSPYIQTQDSATSLMRWLTERIMRPRKSVGVEVFGLPILQLGDLVELDYASPNGFNEISLRESKFVIYNMEYSKRFDGLQIRVYLSEVPS